MVRMFWIAALAGIAFANEPLVVESVSFSGADLHVPLETQVGRPYDSDAIARDVRYLWSLGRFDDVRVEMSGADVRFILAPRARRTLHEIRMSPHSYGLQPKLPEGSIVDDLRARQIAAEMQKELRLQGYRSAQVSYDFVPSIRRHEVDLRLKVDAGDPVRIQHVEFEGDLGLKPKELRRGLSALRTKPMIPGIWRILPDYSPEAIDADVARLRSLYLSKGFFDARVWADDAITTVRIHAEAGPRFQVHGVDLTKLCPCLLSQRRAAERQGILDFTPTLQVRREGESVAEAATKVELGQPYRVRRIEFFGLHRYGDETARRNMLLDEGAPLDQYLLRKSVARIMQTHLFQDPQARDMVIQRFDQDHVADIKIRLVERKVGSWNLSGPVGPASIAGPLRAAVMSRLPPWGSGLFELSTYTASIGLVAWQQPIIAALAVKKFVPIFALTRGFLPGDSFRSGFSIAPQLGWQGSLIATGASQLQGRLLPLLTPNRGLTPELTVSVEGDVSGAILCEAPKPRLKLLRSAAALAVRLPTSLTGL